MSPLFVVEELSPGAERLLGIFIHAAMTTPNDMIESLVAVNYGHASLQTQELFRQSLQVLVELTKTQMQRETAARLCAGGVISTVH